QVTAPARGKPVRITVATGGTASQPAPGAAERALGGPPAGGKAQPPASSATSAPATTRLARPESSTTHSSWSCRNPSGASRGPLRICSIATPGSVSNRSTASPEAGAEAPSRRRPAGQRSVIDAGDRTARTAVDGGGLPLPRLLASSREVLLSSRPSR